MATPTPNNPNPPKKPAPAGDAEEAVARRRQGRSRPQPAGHGRRRRSPAAARPPAKPAQAGRQGRPPEARRQAAAREAGAEARARDTASSARCSSTSASSTKPSSGRCSKRRATPTCPLGQVVLDRGLVTEDQLLQAMAEQHGMRVVNLEEIKPTPEAVKLVPENMAEVYKVLPLSFENDTLTVAMSDPNNLPALDDLRNFLGIKQVKAVLAPAQADRGGDQDRVLAGKEESIVDLIAALEADPNSGTRRPRDLHRPRRHARKWPTSAPVRKLINMVLLMAIKDHASDIHFEPFEDEYKMRYRCDGVLYEMVPPPRHLADGHRQPHQGHVQPRHRRAPAAAGRPHRAERRRQPGRHARQRAADHVRRERRHPRARPHGRQPRPRKDRHGRRSCSPSSAS